MILVLISPRQAGLPFAAWLPEEAGRLVAVTAAGTDVGSGFAEVVTVPDYTCDDAVLAAAGEAARRHRPRAVLALAEADVERAARLRSELALPGLDTTAAAAYRDKVLMKEYARTAGIPVPAFAPVATVRDITDFMAAHPGRVVVKPRSGSGSTGVHVIDAPGRAAPWPTCWRTARTRSRSSSRAPCTTWTSSGWGASRWPPWRPGTRARAA